VMRDGRGVGYQDAEPFGTRHCHVHSSVIREETYRVLGV
jgi:hypothetical protein